MTILAAVEKLRGEGYEVFWCDYRVASGRYEVIGKKRRWRWSRFRMDWHYKMILPEEGT